MLTLGKVGRPHGLRGAFFVAGRDDVIPKHVKTVLIGNSPATAEEATITQSLMQANRPLLVCTLANDRTSAERLTNLNIYASQSTVKAKTKPNEVYWADLTGADVYGSDGVKLGRITQVYNAGASDIATLVADNGKSVEIALTSDYVGDPLKLETASGQSLLHLVVPAATFADVWEDA